MRKITYLITRSDVIGGANVHLLDLIPNVEKHGYEVELLIGGRGVVYEKAVVLGIPTYPVDSLVREINLQKDYKAYKVIKRHLQHSKPDLLHIHSSKAGILGRIAAKKLNIPVVFTAHGWAFTDGVSKSKRFLYKNIERYFASYANKIITVSNYDRSLALENGVGSRDQLVTIHNGLPALKGKHETISNATCQLIMVARFDAPKEQMSLLRALNQMKDYDWHLRLIGDGPMLDTCKLFVEQCGLKGKVDFLGQRDDVGQQLNKADVFILISRWEGLPLSILEAMRASLPVIASDVGGVSEAVIDRETGFTISRDNENLLVEKLRLLINNANLRRQMGQAGEQRFLEFFTIDEMIRKTINVYNGAFK